MMLHFFMPIVIYICVCVSERVSSLHEIGKMRGPRIYKFMKMVRLK